MFGFRLRRLFVALLVVAMVVGLPGPSMQGAAMAAAGGAGCADCDAGPGDGACAVACTAVPAIGDAADTLQWIGPASFGTQVGDNESGLAPGPDPSPPRNSHSS